MDARRIGDESTEQGAPPDLHGDDDDDDDDDLNRESEYPIGDSGFREFEDRLRDHENDIPRHLQPLQLEARCSNFKSYRDEMRSGATTSSSSTG